MIQNKNINELNYLSVLAISPAIKLGNIKYNKELILSEIRNHSGECNLLVFPELCVTGATCGDAFLQDDILRNVDDALYSIIEASYEEHSTIILGTPTLINGKLINCALFISDGKLLGIIPKIIKDRWFSPPDISSLMINGYEVKIVEDLLFQSFCNIGVCVGGLSIATMNNLTDADIVVCIDAKPYQFATERDLTDELITLSKMTNKAIVYVNTNPNESTTDAVFSGEMLIVECGKIVANNYYLNVSHKSSDTFSDNDIFDSSLQFDSPLSFDTKYYKAEIDIDLIKGAKKREELSSNFKPQKSLQKLLNNATNNELVKFDFIGKELNEIRRYTVSATHRALSGKLKSIYVDPFSTQYILDNPFKAFEIINAQAYSLARRIKHINAKSVVIGVSSGIDSTLSLLVSVRCFDILGLDKKNIFALSMPGLGTAADSNDIAEKMALSLGVSYSVISISSAVRQHFKDIQHDESIKNIVYENAQARQRAIVLFDYANKMNGIVVGTGDMSEVALGWATYNGDHISNYNVNGGVPKTVAKAVLESLIRSKIFPSLDIAQLARVLSRPISPELLPETETGEVQSTEEILGPYELHDFFLFYYLTYFLSEEKLLYITKYTFDGRYSDEEIEKCLKTFIQRFNSNQYKRSCSADGLSIFNISLSPRGGLVYPSDISMKNA